MSDAATLLAPSIKHATLTAPRSAVWRAWTDQQELAKWFDRDARVELRAGGPYEILFLMDNPPDLQGGEGNTVQAFSAEKSLDFTWNAPPDFGPLRDIRTHVRIELSDADNGTDLTLTHDGWGVATDWSPVREYFDRAWDHVMNALNSHLSSS